MASSSIRMWVGAALATALVFGCGDDGDSGADTEDGSGTSGGETDSAGTTAPSSSSGGSGPENCVPGNQDCECLDGSCVGTLSCVEGMCLPGPEIDLDEGEMTALAGVRLPIQFEVLADEFTWSQVDGPMTDLGDPTASPLILDLPPGAAGQSITLRLTATRNTVMSTDDVVVQIVDAGVEDAFANVDADPPPAPLMLGQTEAVEFFGGELWVASSTEGTLTQVFGDGNVGSSYDLGGTPVSLRRGEIPEGDDGLDVLYFADPMGQSINAFVFGNQQVRTITDADVDGNPLGPVTFVAGAPDFGDLVFTNGTGGQLFYYDAFSGTTLQLLDATALGPNPHALEFGPDGYLFVGTIGKVWKVPILGEDIDDSDPDNPQTIEAGPPELYLDLGAETDTNLEVDGLAFDGAFNLFVGTSGNSTLHLALYVPEGATSVTNSWARPGNALGRFIGLRHGDGDFSGRSLYFASGAEGRVGRVYTGVSRNL